MAEGKDVKSYAEGHRGRLRARYRQNGEAALQDYELLELLLTFAIPRRDTKLLAKKLLERFGTLARVFEAEPVARISLIRPLAFIVVHNHPSGDPTPSDHDRELTRTLKVAAATVGLRFLDHLIIGEAAPFSFKANRLL